MNIIEFHNAGCSPLTLTLADGSHCFVGPKAAARIPVGLAGSADVNAARLRGELVLVRVIPCQEAAPPAAVEADRVVSASDPAS
jgi:hypothetical protein